MCGRPADSFDQCHDTIYSTGHITEFVDELLVISLDIQMPFTPGPSATINQPYVS